MNFLLIVCNLVVLWKKCVHNRIVIVPVRTVFVFLSRLNCLDLRASSGGKSLPSMVPTITGTINRKRIVG